MSVSVASAVEHTAAAPVFQMALAYAERGLMLLPCRLDGRPAAPGGLYNAFDDPDRIRNWFTKGNWQLGIAVDASGLVVIDAKDPDALRAYFDAAGVTLPTTYTAKTPFGGLQYYYTKRPGAFYPNRLCPGVDIKLSGFVMAPRSRGCSAGDGSMGNYAVVTMAEIAPAPDWLASVPSSSCSAAEALTAERALDEDEIDAMLWFINPRIGHEEWLGVLMAIHRATNGSARGMSAAVDWSCAGERRNPSEVEDQWRRLAAVGKGGKLVSLAAIAEEHGADLEALGERIKLRRQKAVCRQQPNLVSLNLCDIGSEASQSASVRTALCKEAVFPQSLPRVIQSLPAEALAQRVHQLRGSILSADSVAPKLIQNYLIKGILLRSSVAMLYGPSGTGKTFYTLHLAHCIASGKPFDGHKVRQGTVIYVSAEGTGSIENRLAAMGAGLSPNLKVLPQSVDLHSNDIDLTAVVELANEITASAGEVALVVIDTLARSFGGGDENVAAEMNKVLSRLTALKQELDTTVLIVHHTGKDVERGARGSSALKAAVETELEIKPIGGGCIEVRTTKQRDLDAEWSHCFKLVPVVLGEDEDRDPVTSCRIEFVDRSSIKSEKIHGFAQKKVLVLLSSFTQAHGVECEVEVGGRKLLVRKVDRRTFLRFALSEPGDDPEEQLNDRNVRDSIGRLLKKGISVKMIAIFG